LFIQDKSRYGIKGLVSYDDFYLKGIYILLNNF
jgi:hypothetical protein